MTCVASGWLQYFLGHTGLSGHLEGCHSLVTAWRLELHNHVSELKVLATFVAFMGYFVEVCIEAIQIKTRFTSRSDDLLGESLSL